MPVYPVYVDLVDLFLEEAERCHMDFYLGLYDSGKYWHEGNFRKELDINVELAEELTKKYGNRKAFKGWYASHELHGYDENQLKLITSAHSLFDRYTELIRDYSE